MSHKFRDVTFMSAAEKMATLRAWVRFLKSGLRFEQFTKGLYGHLIQHCSFIAHYNRAQFYGHYFEAGDSTVQFLSQFDSRGPCLSVEYGHRLWLSGDYEDINRAMIFEAQAFIPALIESANRRQRVHDVAEAHALLAKHGIGLRNRDAASVAENDVRREPSSAQELLPYS